MKSRNHISPLSVILRIEGLKRCVCRGNNPENIMDYGYGTHFAQWQWRSIHDPAVVKGLFKRDGSGEMNWTLTQILKLSNKFQ